MLVRTWSSRVLPLALLAVGLMITPQAIGSPQESEKAEEAVQRQAELAAREALAAAMQEVMTHREAAMAQGEEARAQLERAHERMRMVAPQLARLRSLSMLGGGSTEHLLANAEELGLTAEQQESLRGADKAARRERIERDARVQVAELDLEDMVRDADTADLSAVEAKMMEIAQLRVQGRIADLRLRRQIDGILTPEQRDKAKEMGGHMMMFRGDGPHWRIQGPGAAFFEFDGLLEPFEWIEEFELAPRSFEFHFKSDDDQDAEAPRAPEAPQAPQAPQAKTRTRTF